jgi:hypothetical protein
MISHPGTLFSAVVVLLCVTVRPADAQQSISEVLSFLVTNRSIATDDFVRDEQAASATRDTISRFLVLELATLPITSAGGFTYRLDPTLGTVIRSSDSFGPFFTERSLTTGTRQAALGVSYRSTSFDNIDGRKLRDGTLVSTASVLSGESQPFDVETVSLRIRSETMTVFGSYGVTDRLDISAAVPFVRVNLSGERIDTYRGRQLIQALLSPCHAASSFGSRARLYPATVRVNCAPTRSVPRSMVWASGPTVLPQPKTSSIRLRMRWLTA